LCLKCSTAQAAKPSHVSLQPHYVTQAHLAVLHQEGLPQQHIARFHVPVCNMMLIVQLRQACQQLVGDAAHSLGRQALATTPAEVQHM
jgi:hypothetical protein